MFSWIIGVFLCLHICVVPFFKNCLCILVRCNGIVIISQIYSALTLLCLEKEIETHSSTLAWRIPLTEEPGGLQSMGSQRVEHDGGTSLSLHNSLLYLQMSRDSFPFLCSYCFSQKQSFSSLSSCNHFKSKFFTLYIYQSAF